MRASANTAARRETPARHRRTVVIIVADELRPALLARIREELPKGVPHLYELTDDELDLRPLMRDEMRALPCAEFERVLHPVFEEDELTLILIGTALGGIAGAAQALSGI